MKHNLYLLFAGIASAMISILHMAIIIGGPAWYRFFGAGEEMAQLAESGSSYPALVTSAIALFFTIWAFYAFSGAGLIRRLPFLKLGLAVIAAVFLIRGVAGIPLAIMLEDPYLNELEGRMTFMILSSVISLSLGLLYLFGLIRLVKGRLH